MEINYKSSYTGDIYTEELKDYVAKSFENNLVEGELETIQSTISDLTNYCGQLTEILVKRGLLTLEEIDSMLPHQMKSLIFEGD